MKKAKTSKQSLAPRWIPLSVIGGILVFAGFAGYQMVSAAGVFTNPGCDPTATAGPAACNTAAPLLLNRDSETASATLINSGSQLIRTPVQIGYSGQIIPSTLDVFNMVNLQPGAKIQTQGTFTGQAINVTSSDDAIVATTSGGTSGSTKAALKGIASNVNAYGLYVQNTINNSSSYALFADGGTSGNAAKFTGPVQLSNGTQTVTLKVNLSNQLLVNDAPVGGSSKNVELTAAAGVSIIPYNVYANMFGGTPNQYKVTSYTVSYAETNTNIRKWVPLPYDAANNYYEECDSTGTYIGKLYLKNPSSVNPVTFRVTVFHDNTPITCTGADTTGPTIIGVGGGLGVAANWWVGAPTANPPAIPLSATITDASGVILSSVVFYIDYPSPNTQIAGTVTKAANKYTIQAPAWAPLQSQNTGGGATRRNITVYACDILNNCATSFAFPLQVTVNQNYEPCQLNRCLKDNGPTSSCCQETGICQDPNATCAVL